MKDIIVSPVGRAVQYLRMSTDRQIYSLENQKNAISEYARRAGYEIIDTYADEGISGLTLRERFELNRLLRDVTDPNRLFSTILVLDISRWGRFQDPDQHAAYEFLCRDMGVNVEYVAEAFQNDGSIASSILKHLKRVMAGEYSRELSVKVSRGQALAASKGFKQGGITLYGFRRMQVDEDGVERGILNRNDRKGLASDRIIIVPGPKEEIAIVRRIYRQFVKLRHSIDTIVRSLNLDEISTGTEHPWSHHRVQRILTTELVIGIYVYNQTSQKLKSKLVKNPEVLWVKSPMGRPIISQKDFREAQNILRHRSDSYSKSKILASVKRLYKKEGTLNSVMLNSSPDVPSTPTLRSHFGSLESLYALVGYVPGGWSDDQVTAARSFMRNKVERAKFSDGELEMLKGLISLLKDKGELSHALINDCAYLKSAETYRIHFGTLANAYKIVGYRSKALWNRRSRKNMSEGEIIAGLKRIHAKYGRLTVALVSGDKDMPSYRWIYKTYGNIFNLYRLAGFELTRGKQVSIARYCALSKFRKGSAGINTPYLSSVTTITDEELIAGLQRLYKANGYIGSRLIDEDPSLPTARSFYKRFASLYHAYAFAGITDSPEKLKAMARNPMLRNWNFTPLERRRT